MRAYPDGFARLDAPIPLWDAAAEVLATASFRDIHGGNIPAYVANCAKRCAASHAIQGPMKAQKKTPNFT
jgi:hypothetical protein